MNHNFIDLCLFFVLLLFMQQQNQMRYRRDTADTRSLAVTDDCKSCPKVPTSSQSSVVKNKPSVILRASYGHCSAGRDEGEASTEFVLSTERNSVSDWEELFFVKSNCLLLKQQLLVFMIVKSSPEESHFVILLAHPIFLQHVFTFFWLFVF